MMFSMNIDNPPCTDCEHEPHCAKQEVACAAFGRYISNTHSTPQYLQHQPGEKPHWLYYTAMYGKYYLRQPPNGKCPIALKSASLLELIELGIHEVDDIVQIVPWYDRLNHRNRTGVIKMLAALERSGAIKKVGDQYTITLKDNLDVD